MFSIKNFLISLKNKLLLPFNKNEYKNKVIKHYMINKGKYLPHYLYINNVETNIQIQWLRNDQEIFDHLSTLIDPDYNYCYFINCKYKFNTIGFYSEFDVVIVDLYWRVIHLYHNLKPNTTNIQFSKTGHIFFFYKNSINALDIKLNDYLRVMPQVL